MRKMVVEAKRRISLLLAAAMLAGSIPQDVLAVSAAEAYTEAVTEETVQEEEGGIGIESERLVQEAEDINEDTYTVAVEIFREDKAKVTFESGYDEAEERIKANQDLSFRVTPKDGYRIGTVSYRISETEITEEIETAEDPEEIREIDEAGKTEDTEDIDTDDNVYAKNIEAAEYTEITDIEEENILEPDEEGVYTISADNITGNLVIIVMAERAEEEEKEGTEEAEENSPELKENEGDAVSGNDIAQSTAETETEQEEETAVTEEAEKMDTEFDQTGDEERTALAEEEITYSSETISPKEVLPAQDSYYETKLTLKKGAASVYTGQQEAVVATPVFGKNTTYLSIGKAEIIGYSNMSGSYSSDDYKVKAENNEVKLTVEPGAASGRLTIQVAAVADEDRNMYPATATITVNVIKGIEAIRVDMPQNQVYKAAGKAASFTTAITYNGGATGTLQPKSKKVTWELLDWDDQVINVNHELYGKISIKNGKVTIDKSFIPDEDENKNVFTVKATAADYTGSTVSDEGVFTVAGQATALGDVVIVRSITAGLTASAQYQVVAQSGDTVRADVFSTNWVDDNPNGPLVRVVKPGVEKKDIYTEEEFVSSSLYSIKFSNNAVGFAYYEGSREPYLEVSKQVKNLKITATALDGSKNTATLEKLTINYAQTEELALSIYNQIANREMDAADQYRENKKNNQPIIFYGAKNTVFLVRLTDKNGQYINEIANHKLKVSGGKVIYSDVNTYGVMATGDTLTLTLTDNEKNITKTYVLVNLGLGTESVKVTTKDSLAASTRDEQTITYTVSGKNAASYQQVLVTVNSLDAYASKNYISTNYHQLLYASQGTIGQVMPVKEGKVTLTFKEAELSAYAYKLNFSFGHVDKDGNFIAATKEIPVTLKAAVPKVQKAENAKLNTKYTLGLADNGKVKLTLSNLKATLNKDIQIYSANINGQSNNFLEYFELDDSGFALQLKSTADLSNIPAKGLTLTGYVGGYTYTDSKGLTGYGPSAGTQITVTIKPNVLKYTMTSAAVLEGEVEATVKAVANKSNVNLSHVYTEDAVFQAELTEHGDAVGLTGTDVKPGSRKVSLYILPKDSAYKPKLDELKAAVDAAGETKRPEAEKAYGDAMKTYGISVSTTVAVKAKSTATGKVKLAGTKAVFSAESYNTDTDSYTAVIPYTKVVNHRLEQVSFTNMVQVEKDGAAAELMTVVFDDAEETITISMTRDNLLKAVGANKVGYGKALKAVLKVTFGEGIKEEAFTLTLTMPKKAMTLAEAVAAVEKAGLNGLGIEEIKAKLAAMLPKDTAVSFEVKEGTSQPADNDRDVDGSQSYVITLKEGTATREIVVSRIIPATGKKPADLEDDLNSFVQNYSDVTGDTTVTQLAVAAREALSIDSYPNLRLKATKNHSQKATGVQMGELEVIYEIIDVKYNYPGIRVVKLYTFEAENTDDTGSDTDTDTDMSAAIDTPWKRTLVYQIIPGAVDKIFNTFPVFQQVASKEGISRSIGLKIYEDYKDTSIALVDLRHRYDGFPSSTIDKSTITLTLAVNTGRIGFDRENDLSGYSRQGVEATILHEMLHAFMYDSCINGMLGVDSSGTYVDNNRFPTWFYEGMAQTVWGAGDNGNDFLASTGKNGLGLTENSSFEEIREVLSSKEGSIGAPGYGNYIPAQYGTGYLACMYLGYSTIGKPEDYTPADIARGLNTMLEKIIAGYSLDTLIKEVTNEQFTSTSNFQDNFPKSDEAIRFVQGLLKKIGSSGNGSVVGTTFEDSDLLEDRDFTSGLYSGYYRIDPLNEAVYSSANGTRDWGTGLHMQNGSNFLTKTLK